MRPRVGINSEPSPYALWIILCISGSPEFSAQRTPRLLSETVQESDGRSCCWSMEGAKRQLFGGGDGGQSLKV